MNAIDTLHDAVDDALAVFVDTQWERAYRNTAPAALAKLETLLQAAERVVSYGGGLPGPDYYILAAAVRDAKGES